MNSPLMHYAMILILSRHCKRLAARTARKMTNGVALGWCWWIFAPCAASPTRTIMWAHIIRWNTAKKIQWKYNRSDFVVTDCTSTRVRVLQYFVTIKFGADLETLAMICPIRSSMHAIVPAGKIHWHFPHLSKLKVYGSQILNYLSRFTLHWNMHGVGWGFNSFHKFQNPISYIRV